MRAGDLVVQQADLPPAVAEDCFDERALLWYGQHGWIVDLGNGEQMRLATFDVADEVLAIEARTRAGAADHEAFLAAVDELLETLTISETPVE